MNLKQAGILGFYAGLAVGGGVAYVMTKRRLRLKYWRIAADEIRESKEFYERKYKTKSPEALLEELHPEEIETWQVKDAVEKLGYSITEKEEKLPPDPRTDAERGRVPTDDGTGHVDLPGEREIDTIHGLNVFAQRDKEMEWDQEQEEAYRKQQPGTPYVISEDEFNDDNPHYEKIALTYWVGDDVLAESHATGTESHIPDPDTVVGVENLDKFGYGSGDPNMVYVRNDRMSCDFEIVLQQGSYAKTVLGFDDSLEHADRPKNRQLRRFRE